MLQDIEIIDRFGRRRRARKGEVPRTVNGFTSPRP